MRPSQAASFIQRSDPEYDYQLLQRVGSGTYGDVYKARSTQKGQLTAIKIIKLEPGDDFGIIQQEIIMMRDCRHANIVNYFGSYLRRDKLWICMEYCGGGSMQDIYHITGPVPERTIAFICRETLTGLDYLHCHGKMHRDIKGANILLTDEGDIKLADFGVSAQITATICKRKSFIGTPYWMAPEVAAVERKGGYNQQCDIWAVGVTAIEFAELQPPMFDLHPMRALYLMSKSSFKPPTLKDKQKWSSDFQAFIKIALTKNPKKRPTAEKLLEAPFVHGSDLHRRLTQTLMETARNPNYNDTDDDDDGGFKEVRKRIPSRRLNPDGRTPSEPNLDGMVPVVIPREDDPCLFDYADGSRNEPQVPSPESHGEQGRPDQPRSSAYQTAGYDNVGGVSIPPERLYPDLDPEAFSAEDLHSDVDRSLTLQPSSTAVTVTPPQNLVHPSAPPPPPPPAAFLNNASDVREQEGGVVTQAANVDDAVLGIVSAQKDRPPDVPEEKPPAPEAAALATEDPPPPTPPKTQQHARNGEEGSDGDAPPTVPPRKPKHLMKQQDKREGTTANGLPPTPKVIMGAGFSKVFNGCPLRINHTASWVHPDTRDQHILIGAEEGIYTLNLNEIHENNLELIHARRCMWLYIVKNVMMSLSGKNNQLFRHDLLALHSVKSSRFSLPINKVPEKFVPHQLRKLQSTTKVPETKGCEKCCVGRNPYNGYKYLCAANSSGVLLMQWYDPLNKFMMLKHFETALPPQLSVFEMLITPGQEYPMVCVGVRKGEDKAAVKFDIINLNTGAAWYPDSSAGPLDTTNVTQLEKDTILVCYDNQVKVVNLNGRLKSSRRRASELHFDFSVESLVCLPDSVLAFHKHGMQGRSFHANEVTQEIFDNTRVFRMLGSDRVIFLESRPTNDIGCASNLYVLTGHENNL